jgi:AraC family transcriptional regulator
MAAEHIALDLGLSVSYLRRVFRNTTGQTLHDFLEQARIAKACALLTETDVPLKVVAFMAGFAQHSTFSYAFKRKTGLTPTEYRSRKLL